MPSLLTLDRLRSIAAQALGVDRALLSDSDQLTTLNEAPLLAIRELGAARDWPHLRTDLRITCYAGREWSLLPANFRRFTRSDGLSYAAGQTSVCVRWSDSLEIKRLRAAAASSNFPQQAVIGETLATESGAATVAGVGAFTGAYTYRWMHIATDGRTRVSAEFSATAASNTHIAVSGWPAVAGTLSLWRTAAGGATLYKHPNLTINPATTSSYNDSTADGSLTTATTFPDEPTTGVTLNHRQKIQWWPTPSAAHVILGSYYRHPTEPAAGSDVVDQPAALDAALRALTRIVVRREFDRDIPDALQMEYQRALGEAAAALREQNPSDGRSLNNVVRSQIMALEEGRTITLASPYQ